MTSRQKQNFGRPRAAVQKLPSGRYTWRVIDPLDIIYARASQPLPRRDDARLEARGALQQLLQHT